MMSSSTTWIRSPPTFSAVLQPGERTLYELPWNGDSCITRRSMLGERCWRRTTARPGGTASGALPAVETERDHFRSVRRRRGVGEGRSDRRAACGPAARRGPGPCASSGNPCREDVEHGCHIGRGLGVGREEGLDVGRVMVRRRTAEQARARTPSSAGRYRLAVAGTAIRVPRCWCCNAGPGGQMFSSAHFAVAVADFTRRSEEAEAGLPPGHSQCGW